MTQPKKVVKCEICKQKFAGVETLNHEKETGHNSWTLLGVKMNIVRSIFQLKVSVIGAGKVAERVYGRPDATLKILEFSIALLSFGIRMAVRV